MKQAIQKLISVAEAELGYLEKATNNQLNDKTANAGQNNYTKYGAYWGDANGYWCDYFVDWCFVQAFGKDKAKSLLHGFSGYTPTSAQCFKNAGQWSHSPQVGAVIFFHNSERICHTGIVTEVTSGTIQTIEGNTSGGSSLVPNGGCVARKTYSRNYDRIDGYGMPDYPEDEPMYNSLLEAVEGTANLARNWIYGDSSTLPPCEYETKEINGVLVSGHFTACERLIARAMWDWKAGYRDQPVGGFTTYNIEDYFLSHGAYKNTDPNKVKDNSVVIMQRKGYPVKHYMSHVFFVKKFRSVNDIDKYDAGSQARLNVGCFFGHVPLNEWSDMDFYCSFSFEKPSKPLPDNWDEVVGHDRYETAAILAKRTFDKPKNIVLVSGENFPDALCAFGYAGLINAPVLLTENMQLSTATYNLVKQWQSVTGCVVIGKAIKGQTAGILFNLGVETITYCGGADRYQTAEMVAESTPSDTVVVCSGDKFADAACIAPILYRNHWPVLLAHDGMLSDSSKAMLAKYDHIYVVGGEKAVSSDNFDRSIARIAGDTRYSTSIALLKHFNDSSRELICVSGQDKAFADALAVACFASKKNAPVILAEENLSYIAQNKPEHGYIIGGLDKDLIADVL